MWEHRRSSACRARKRTTRALMQMSRSPRRDTWALLVATAIQPPFWSKSNAASGRGGRGRGGFAGSRRATPCMVWGELSARVTASTQVRVKARRRRGSTKSRVCGGSIVSPSRRYEYGYGYPGRRSRGALGCAARTAVVATTAVLSIRYFVMPRADFSA